MIAARRRRTGSRRITSNVFFTVPIVVGIVVGIIVFFGATPSGGALGEGASTAGSPVATGAQLFQLQCSSCHGLDGRGVSGRGPSLEPEGEAATDFVLRTGRMPLAAPNLQATRGPVRYSEQEILALVAYVGSIGDGPGIPTIDTTDANIASGGRLFRLNCAACHVTTGAGAPIGSGQQAPSLARSTATQVGEAIIVGPGAMPVFGSLRTQQTNDIAAYVAKLQRDDTTAATSFGGAGPVAEGLAAWIIALIPLVALTRWIGSAKAGRDRPVPDSPEPDSPEAGGPGPESPAPENVEYVLAGRVTDHGAAVARRTTNEPGSQAKGSTVMLVGSPSDVSAATDPPGKRRPLLVVGVLAVINWFGRRLRPDGS